LGDLEAESIAAWSPAVGKVFFPLPLGKDRKLGDGVVSRMR